MSNRFEPMEFPSDTATPPAAPTQALTIEQREALAITGKAQAIVVRNQDDLSAANAFLQDIERLTRKIGASFDPQIEQAHKLHKSLLAEKKKFTDPLDAAKRIVSPKVAEYLAEEDRKQLEIAREKARADAEAQRIADEAAEKAFQLTKKGQDARAEAVLDKAIAKVEEIKAAAPVVPEAPIKTGLAMREDWKFEVTDASLIPREYLCVDEQKIGRVVRAMKGQGITIPGIRVYSVKSVNVRQP